MRPVLRNVLLDFRVIDRQHAIEPHANAGTLGPDAVFVPLVGLQCSLLRLVARTSEKCLSTALVVERSVVAFSEIRLIADHLVMVRNAPAAELHSAVHEAFRPDELVLEPQVEVAVLAFRGNELIARDRRFERAGGDGSVFNTPRLLRVPRPAGKALALEERF